MSVSLSVWILVAAAIGYLILIAGSIGVVLSENRNPIRALAWVIALLFLPGVGLLFYFFFGRGIKNIHIISRRNKRKLLHKSSSVQINLDATPYDYREKQLIKLVTSLSHTPLTINNEVKVFTDGSSKFNSLKRDLLEAKEYIYLQYYIFSDDSTGSEIAKILMKKAREGVKVKVLYDHVGSFSARNRFFRTMREAGVEAHPFFKVTFPQLANRVNWRNHRKIVIIDGKSAYIGGMNIADRYVFGQSDGSAWRDTHLRVRGEIINQLIYSFLIDWNFLNPKAGFSTLPIVNKEINNKCGMQLISSGPTDQWGNISLVFLKAITSAKRSIYIQTPYFLPSDPLQRALEAAALSKIDVRIMIPIKSDSKMLQYASFSYISQCLQAGIKVYLYNPGMLHAKAMIIDDDIVSTGSSNFDYRSFENNFECNLMVYDKEFNARMREIFFNDLSQCSKITYGEWKKRPIHQRAAESIFRLFSPIL
ncbi:MAG: cardiolipin synthase [Bacteroidales bacterium]|nr:cardiolipin synthase [Bacteroidales bacterium]